MLLYIYIFVILLSLYKYITYYLFNLMIFNRAPGVQRDYELKVPVNDVIIHPNQGELVSCDQSGSIKVWDLSENLCTHELVKINNNNYNNNSNSNNNNNNNINININVYI